jgi:hypothetical protein
VSLVSEETLFKSIDSLSAQLKDFERADPQQIDKLFRLLKDIQNMPSQTQTTTLDTLLQILVAVVCSSAHKPFSA